MGEIVVDTKLRNKNFLNGLKDMSQKTETLIKQFNKKIDVIHKEQVEVDNLKAKYNELVSGATVPSSVKKLNKELQNTEKSIEDITTKYNAVLEKIEIATPLETDWLKDSPEIKQETQAKIKSLNTEANSLFMELDAAQDKADKLKKKLEEAKLNPDSIKEVAELKNKIDLTNQSIQSSTLEANKLATKVNQNAKSDFFNKYFGGVDDVGKKVDKFKNKMTRLISTAMVFSIIRSGLTSLSRSMLQILKTNTDFSSSLNQIKANLMTAFAPIYNACLPAINSMMSALAKLTGTLSIFIAGLFGKSIKQTTNEAKKLSSSLKDVKNSGQAAADSLASFDKLEVNNDNKTSSGSNSGGIENIDYNGKITYSQKLLDLLNKLKNIVIQNKDLFKVLGITILGAFAISKIIGFISQFKSLGGLIKNVSGLFVQVGEDGTKSFNKVGAGITIGIAGLVLLATNIISLITNWDKLDNKQKAVKIGMALVGAAAIALGYSIATGFSIATLGTGALIAAGAALVIGIGTLIAKCLSQKEAIKSVEDAQKSLKEAQDEYASAQDEYVSAVDKAEEAFKKLKDAQDKTGISGQELYDKVKDGTLDYKNMTDAQKEVYKAYLENKNAQDNLEESTKKLTDAKKKEMLASFDNQLAIAAESGSYDEYKKSVVQAFEEGKISADEARDLIEKSMSSMSKSAQQTFKEDLPDSIKEGLEPDKYKTKLQKLKSFFDDAWSYISNGASNMFKKIGDKWDKFWGKTKKVSAASNGGTLDTSGISPHSLLNNSIAVADEPALASGAVIPPNKKFRAILGDQTYGNNLEAPESLIRKIVREESGNNSSPVLNATFVAKLDSGEELGRATIKGIHIVQEIDGKTYVLN